MLIFSYCLFWAKTSPLHYFLFIYSCHVQLRIFELVTLISFYPAVLQITFISDFSLDPHHTFDPCSDRTTPVILDVKVRFIHVVDRDITLTYNKEITYWNFNYFTEAYNTYTDKKNPGENVPWIIVFAEAFILDDLNFYLKQINFPGVGFKTKTGHWPIYICVNYLW